LLWNNYKILSCNWINLYSIKNFSGIFFHIFVFYATFCDLYMAKNFFNEIDIYKSIWVVYSL